MLKKLTIEHYKGFYEEQSVDFAEPDNEKNGSGLTVIVGPNNTGKTTLLECLLFATNIHQRKFEKSERHTNDSPKITIKTNLETCAFTNIDDGSQIKTEGNCNVNFELIPSRRHWASETNNEWSHDQFVNQSTINSIRNASGTDTAAVLKNINRNKSQKKLLNSYFQLIIPDFTGWTIDSEGGVDYVEYQTELTKHKAHFSGDGIISIFRICAHLAADDKARVLIIDEPELSLHPNAQKALAKIISIASKDRQIIVCTHSPYFINWDDFINGAKYIRLNKYNNEKCKISKLNNSSCYSKFIGNSHKNWHRPQLLDYVAKEIFLQKRYYFLKGKKMLLL
jgi:predicted ATP-dependent endonuclease of OLD family